MRPIALYILLVLACVVETSQAAEKTITPFYLPFSAEEFPNLASELQTALNEAGLSNFKVNTTDYWHPYQQGLRQGRQGVYFAAPHFSAWAITQNKFVPILRLKGKLQYVIAARRADSHIFEVNDLAGKTVCTQRAPNLDFLLSRTALKKALILARSKSVSSVPLAMRSNNTACQAFSVSEHIFNRFNKAQPFRFIRLSQSKASSNYSFIIDRKTALSQAPALKKFLRSRDALSILHPLYRILAIEANILKHQVPVEPSNGVNLKSD